MTWTTPTIVLLSVCGCLSAVLHGAIMKVGVVLMDETVDMDKVSEFWKSEVIPLSGNVRFGVLKSGASNFSSIEDPKQLIRIVESTKAAPYDDDDDDDDDDEDDDDLYKFLLEGVTNAQMEKDIVLFTGRMMDNEPLPTGYADNFLKKRTKVFVFWTKDSLPHAHPLQKLANATGGLFRMLSPLTRTSGEVRARSGHDTSKVWSLKTEASDESEQESLRKLERVRFPDTDIQGKVEGGKSAINNQGINSPGGRQQVRRNFIPIKVEVASSSTLHLTPGTQHRIQFDVTNNLYKQMSLGFAAMQPQNIIITNVQPQWLTLNPDESVKVDVTVQSTPNAQEGAEGGFEFAVTTPEWGTVRRNALVRFSQKTINDNTDPKVTYTYRGDCRGHETPTTCDTGSWRMEATFLDEDSGLKKVLSEPYGLVFSSPFVAGTRSPVSVYYAASCCSPKIDIWAEDGKGNYVRRSLDAYNQGLLTGEIAAVVLGALLLIFIIIVIIAAIVIIRRRNQTKLVIPRYQGNN